MTRLDRSGVDYLSHSKVTQFERCPRCYYRQYILLERHESQPLLLGSIFHDAAERLYGKAGPANPRLLLKKLPTKKLEPERRRKLLNAVRLLCENRWPEQDDVLSVEEPFFMDLGDDLPPVIGIADLILRQGKKLAVVDHKTSGKFNDTSAGQLVLYAEHARIKFGPRPVIGFYDEYRLVADLSSIRKPAFRRTCVTVSRRLLPPLVSRYHKAWRQIREMSVGNPPASAYDCWFCKSLWRR
jgi:hypothetical protein